MKTTTVVIGAQGLMEKGRVKTLENTWEQNASLTPKDNFVWECLTVCCAKYYPSIPARPLGLWIPSTRTFLTRKGKSKRVRS